MTHRLMGLETEFCLRFSAATSSEPSKQQVCLAILHAVERVVRAAPGEREDDPNFQRFVQNGGAFTFETTSIASTDGLLESATPECRSASQLLLYQRAQEALIRRALPIARARLDADGYPGEITVVKNCRDAKGNVYGTQENYEADIAHGWRLLAYRVGLAVILPITTAILLVPIVTAVLAALFALAVVAAILLVFPLARHWDWDVTIPVPLLRLAECALLAVLRPVALPFLFLLRATAFREIRSGALAFFISRPVVTGAGTLNNDGTFGLSERAQSIAETIRSTPFQRRRAIFDVANFLKPLFLSAGSLVAPVTALFSRRQRLQLGISDSNCAQTAEFLKIGTTALVIDMAEAGFLLDAPRVRRPVSALKRISRDPTLQARVRLRRGGAMTAVQIQRWYLGRAEAFLAAQRVASLESHEIVSLWRSTLDALERDPSSLVGSIDWVTKRSLLQGPRPLGHAARKKIDIKYHELGSGYFSMLEREGIAPVRFSTGDIWEAVFHAPGDTPAWQRGRTIRQAGARRGKTLTSWRAASR